MRQKGEVQSCEGWSKGVTVRTEGTSPLRKLCAHSKDRFKVYGRRIISFIVLVNPGIYTPRRSRRPSPRAHAATHFSCVGKPGWCFNPFPFYERLLRARLAGPFAPICRFWKRTSCLLVTLRTGRAGNQLHLAVIV